MRYGYIKLADETQFTFSELRDDFTCSVYVEKPIDMGFASAECLLPSLAWVAVDGFCDEELAQLTDLVSHNAPMIMRLAREKAGTKLSA